ncbi:MAG: NADH-quinone oxidoreductase subunit 2 [Chloroflexi bacterium ADurb.Bin180]|nr:MAG: NADH-quinone oxidoreductase subunit 2 [Chloroflexi bacterium ADurb.Bin180]HNR96843.1 NAD(P)H-dependent oxidoreductase subunit E [Anaerolineae bacterium]HNT04625.1 NAD(P)H-dependent oxidoreductase subunit E [Anaerolineae bacterium]
MSNQVRDPAKRSMLLTALYIAQEQYGYLTPEALERVADRLGLPVSEVYSAASFYSLYRTQKTGRYLLQVCDGLSCHLVGGAETLVDYLSKRLGIKPGETTLDGQFTLETVQCLASCGTSPAIRVNDALYENMTLEKVDELLETLRGYHA